MNHACYLCGAPSATTVDHIPPKGFFPSPRPSNLITVPCCHACNHIWGKEDEQIRAFLSIANGRSEAGDKIWEGKVLRGVVRNPPLRDHILDHIQHFAVATDTGIEILPAFPAPHGRLERFMVRLTKGFLRHYFPDYDYSSSIFSVRSITPNETNLQKLESGLIGTNYDERGDGVIRYRYGISDSGLSGLWFFMFYDAIWYMVHHSRKQVP